MSNILAYARSLESKKVELSGPIIKGKMDLAELDKMTKKRK